jgi:D-alanyl-D-alanine carboxypeptidase
MRDLQKNPLFSLTVLIVLSCAALAQAQAPSKLPPDVTAKIDQAALQVLAKTGVPSASIAVVKDGQIAYVHAYGDAKLEPRTPAQPVMRYSIGSISKQFTATAVLMLVEQGKMSLDDPVSKWLPNLTRANEVTVRQLLSHTSGYQDYWPQDYVPPFMMQPITAEKIMDLWARKPLDFDPGTKWQYSNTNFVIAGVIVDKVAGAPLMQLLEQRVFRPLHMQSVYDTDQAKLPPGDPLGYMRYALGPLRPAPKEGKGWMFAAGELAMQAEDLARWNISMIEQSVLKPASYKEMETEVRLKSGEGTGYGLGVSVGQAAGHRAISHGGEVSGFTAQNIVFPDDRAAVTVLTNQDAVSASGQIARAIAPLLFPASTSADTAAKEQQARQIFAGLQQGKIDRSLFTDNCNAYFTEQALQDFAGSLGPLGTPQEFAQTSQSLRGGMIHRLFRVRFSNKTLTINDYEMPDGKIEQFLVFAVD